MRLTLYTACRDSERDGTPPEPETAPADLLFENPSDDRTRRFISGELVY